MLMKVQSPEQLVRMFTFTIAIYFVLNRSSRDKLRLNRLRYAERTEKFGLNSSREMFPAGIGRNIDPRNPSLLVTGTSCTGHFEPRLRGRSNWTRRSSGPQC